MFYDTTSIHDISNMISDLAPGKPVLIKGYKTLIDITLNRAPATVLVHEDDDTWSVYDSDPAFPVCIENVDEFFQSCEVLGAHVDTYFEGYPANVIVVYAKMLTLD